MRPRLSSQVGKTDRPKARGGRVGETYITGSTERGTWLVHPGHEVRSISPLFRGAVGEAVQVWYDEQDIPRFILNSSVRRAGPQEPVSGTGGIVEVLFVAPDSEGKVEVWFRNDQQVTNLKIRDSLPRDPDFVKWGSAGDRFVVRTSTPFTDGGSVSVGHAPKYHVFKLNRKSGDKILRSVKPSAEFEVTVDPYTGPITLATIEMSGTMTGTAYSIVATGGPLFGSPYTAEADTPLSRSGSQNLSLPIVLDARIHDGNGGAGIANAKTAHIEDVYLDDDGHVIVLVHVDMDGAQLRQHGVSNVNPISGLISDTPVYRESEDNCVFEEVQDPDTAANPTNFIYPLVGDHMFLIDLTTQTILFKTCVDPIVKTVVTAHNVFRGGKFTTFDAPTEGLDICYYIADSSTGGTGLSFTTLGPEGTPLVAFGDIGIVGPTTRSIQAWNRTVLTFIDDESTFFSAPSIIHSDIETGFQSSGDPNLSGDVRADVTYSVDFYSIAQVKDYQISGLYVPRRRVSAMEHPKGILYLKVRKHNLSDSSSEMGIYALDLETNELKVGAASPVIPAGGGGLGNTGPNVGINNLTFPYIGLLTANLHHLFLRFRFLSSTGPDVLTDNLVLAEIDSPAGSFATVLATTKTPDNEVSLPPTGPTIALVEVLKRDLALTRPDFMYWPSDAPSPAPQGNAFVRAWDRSSGELLLDLNETTVPPKDPKLNTNGLNALKRLSSVVPVLKTVRDDAENIEVNPGPSVRTVEDRTVLASRGLSSPEH